MNYSEMFNYLLEFPQQCKEAIRIADNFWDTYLGGEGSESFVVCGGWDGKYFREGEEKIEISNVVVCGIGGSAIGGDLLDNYLSTELAVPFWVNHGDRLPFWINRKSLVFVVSYSGNTEETLSNYQEAQMRNALIFVITSGGKLIKQCIKDDVPCIKIPEGMLPRVSLGFLFFPLLRSIEKLHLIDEKSQQIEETLKLLKEIVFKIEPKVLGVENLARKIAHRIGDNIPIIYGTSSLKVCVNRWKNQFNENAKAFVLSNLFPSLSHNEIEIWGRGDPLFKKIHLIILRDAKEGEDLKRGIEIFKTIVKKEKIEFDEVWSKGNSLLARLFSLILLGDFVSVYLAEERGVDPCSTPLIDLSKNSL